MDQTDDVVDVPSHSGKRVGRLQTVRRTWPTGWPSRRKLTCARLHDLTDLEVTELGGSQ